MFRSCCSMATGADGGEHRHTWGCLDGGTKLYLGVVAGKGVPVLGGVCLFRMGMRIPSAILWTVRFRGNGAWGMGADARQSACLKRQKDKPLVSRVGRRGLLGVRVCEKHFSARGAARL